MRLDADPIRRLAQLTLLEPRPLDFRNHDYWDIVAAAVVEAWHYTYGLFKRGSLRGRDPHRAMIARLAEVARRHRGVAEAVRRTFGAVFLAQG